MRKLKSLYFHRNGVSGTPFYVAITKEDDGSRKLVVRLEKEMDKETGTKNCFVIDLDLACSAEDVAFGSNSWRGDDWAAWVDKEIKKYVA